MTEHELVTCSADSGTCHRCQAGCERKPGWFMPGEAEAAAALLGMSLADLFTTRLSVDYWYGDDRLSPTTFVLTPTMGDRESGTVLGLDNQGRCTFYVDGRCEIHAAKPFECRQWYCQADPSTLTPHVEVARVWVPYQAQIAELLGAEPELPPVTLLDVLDFTMGMIDRLDPAGADDG
jgi:Fe-S-cluster containining protein